ncbi:MAG: nitrate reductase cytochrome c-type subunit [Bacteroidales bacterium]|nr:nitrate reductase cytochrome c-type subunit [Bacteroidales bacterium]
MNKKLFFLTLLTIALTYACQRSSKPVDWMSDEDIPMQSDQLLSDESPLNTMPEYISLEEGESQTFDRAFENAPPMIPHKVKGLVPIKIDNNECLRCHLANRVKEYNAPILPKSHFTKYRPEIVEEEGLIKVDAKYNEVVAVDLGDKMSGAMFNCTLCHAPQTEVALEVDNLFQADFRKAKGKSKSNLADVIDEGVK